MAVLKSDDPARVIRYPKRQRGSDVYSARGRVLGSWLHYVRMVFQSKDDNISDFGRSIKSCRASVKFLMTFSECPSLR